MASRPPITKNASEQEYIRRALNDCGKSTREIARAAGCHHSYVAYFLKGEKSFQKEKIQALYGSGMVSKPSNKDLGKIEAELSAKEDKKEVEARRIDELKPHPANVDIYGDSADNELVESVKAKGVLTPLLITRDNIVISGHRRMDAAKLAGLDQVPVVVNDSQDMLEIEEMLILTNRQRQKTKEQILREYSKIKKIEAERAKQRKMAGVKIDNLKENFPEGQRKMAGVKIDNLKENFPEGQNVGQSRDIAVEKLEINMSGKTADHGEKVIVKIDEMRSEGKKEEAEDLRKTLNEKSVNAAYKKIAPPKKPARPKCPAEDTEKPAEAEEYICCGKKMFWNDYEYECGECGEPRGEYSDIVEPEIPKCKCGRKLIRGADTWECMYCDNTKDDLVNIIAWKDMEKKKQRELFEKEITKLREKIASLEKENRELKGEKEQEPHYNNFFDGLDLDIPTNDVAGKLQTMIEDAEK